MKIESSTAGRSEKKPDEPPEKPSPAQVSQPSPNDISKPQAKPRQIKYEYHEVIVIKTGQTMGLHIKKNDETGEIFVSNIGLFLKIFREGVHMIYIYIPYDMTHTVHWTS